MVYTDAFWIKTQAGKAAAVSIAEGATRYCAVHTTQGETAHELAKAVERGWIRQFGPMGELRTNDRSGFAPE
eukprot:7296579-Pyramimonas_sp.AAC.1